MASIELVGLSKVYAGGVAAVDDLNLSIADGEFFALLGPSGCGKTTLLRTIAGLEDATGGKLLLDGKDVTKFSPGKRDVAMVFQDYALFPHMDVTDNISYPLRIQKMAKEERREKAASTGAGLGLEGLMDRRPGQLSGGQQQRVAVVRALVNRPKVLLLDEPLGALDLKLRRQMQLELKRIQTEVGITFVHVTHDQEEAMTMADTIAVMNHGRIEQLGSPVELYENPRTAFVAGFLGQSNLLEATVLRRVGELVELDCAGTPLVVPAARLADPGPRVEVGVRPEKIYLRGRGEHEPGHNCLDGVVVDSSFIGVSTQYLVRTADDEELTVFSQNISSQLRRVGEQVTMSWAPEHTFGLAAGAYDDAVAAEVAS